MNAPWWAAASAPEAVAEAVTEAAEADAYAPGLGSVLDAAPDT